MNHKSNKEGFTLIELLVVISIIGVLSSIVFSSLDDARMKARDARRKTDIKQLATAIELFYDETGSYPPEGCNPDTSATGVGVCSNPPVNDNWDTGNGLAENHLGHNITEFISILPKDPINDSTYYYQYEPNCEGPGGVKHGYFIRARMESTGLWFKLTGGEPDLGDPCLSQPLCSVQCW